MRVMKKLIIYLGLFLLTGIILISCEKDLNLAPQDKYSEATFFKTPDQFKLFATQLYSQLPTFSGMLTRETYSDIVIAWSPSTISNGSYSPTPNSDLWSNSYSIIRNTTYLVQKVETADQGIKDQVAVYGGEAKLFRAMAYFHLLRDFGGVPIIDKVLDLDDNDLLYGSRDTRESVVEYILEDINDAVDLLPPESDIAANDKGRVSKEVALAFKARVTLFEGTWRKFRNQDGNTFLDLAISASDQVISGGQYQLFDRRDLLGDQSYRYSFILDIIQTNSANLTKINQTEYILSNRYHRDIRPTTGISAGHLSPSATQQFVDLFLCTDGLPIDKSPLFQGRLTTTSEYENRDLRMTNVLQLPFSRFWAQTPSEYRRNWADPDAGGNIFDVNFGNTTRTGFYPVKFRPETAPPSGIDYPVIRYAEVLLINAEALYEKNGAITDAQLDATINKLRERAGIPKLTNAFATLHGLDQRTEIRRERTIELFLEGFRFDDLRRWKTAEVEMPKAIKGVLWSGTEYATDPRWSAISFPLDTDGHIIVEPVSQRRFEEKHYLMPLPTRQIILNPKLEQNPNWD